MAYLILLPLPITKINKLIFILAIIRVDRIHFSSLQALRTNLVKTRIASLLLAETLRERDAPRTQQYVSLAMTNHHCVSPELQLISSI